MLRDGSEITGKNKTQPVNLNLCNLILIFVETYAHQQVTVLISSSFPSSNNKKSWFTVVCRNILQLLKNNLIYYSGI